MPAVLEAVFGSWAQLTVVFAVLVCGVAVYVLFGFGFGLIAVGTLALVLPQVQDIVVFLLLVSFPVEVFVVMRARKEIRWRGVGLIAIGVLIGVPIGALILRAGEPTVVLTLLGLVLIVAGWMFLKLRAGTTVRWPPVAAPGAGLASGVLAGLFGTGGPPLVLYYHLAGTSKASFRGTLMAIFLLTSLVRLPVYAATGLVTVPRLVAAAVVLPAVLLGAWIGNRIHVQLSEKTFQRLVSALLVVIGAILVVRSLV